ncbi:replication protein [Macaca fascicularis papillomavirus 11]|uniref:Replication protein E1 n=1 Tax=Macaca fascicularis papillomavirus 11 TaxID=656889 RepID=C7DY55_RHPV1|nr:replication protein [Macaca fascicularis papillomavirus 11]
MDPEGTPGEGGCSGWFHVEAIVKTRTGDVVSEDEEEDLNDTGIDLVDFIDDTFSSEQAVEETHGALFQAQETQAHAEAVQVLKRKFVGSPQVSPLQDWGPCIDTDLSPRLDAITLDRTNRGAKRRLFAQDSGYGNTQVETATQVEGENGVGGTGGGAGGSSQDSSGIEEGSQESVQGSGNAGDTSQVSHAALTAVLQRSNARAILLAKFKDTYGVSFMELVRVFKSDKTSCTDWVVGAMGVHHSVAEGLKTLIQPHCTYAHMQCLTCTWGVYLLMLVRFKCGKNRLTVTKFLETLLNVGPQQLLLEPPKLRSSAAAIYWYRTGMSNVSEVIGETPEWIARQTLLQHCLEDAVFDLSRMVQWAYDHDMMDESMIAYEYAQLADVDSNAAAFLKSNQQAKYLRDCATMCKHYKRAERQQMTMSQWIKYRCDRTSDGGDWRPIVQFLRYQGVEFVTFLSILKNFLKGIPKHNCIVLYGPANTGKSFFGMSLMKFLEGSIISYVNSTSHFWLQPLSDCKVAMLDDATPHCWNYVDNYLRNALDGNPISIDRKHRSLVQMKCPLLLITSNTNAGTDARWPYLHSRLKVITFPQPFPFDENGNPVYELNDKNWKSFFSRTWCKLDLQEEDETDTDGEPCRPFKCVPGQNTVSV